MESFAVGCSLFSVLHLNICSFSKNYNQLVNYLSSLNHVFSVIALTETWLTNDSKELGINELPSYNSTHFIRQSRTGGGVSIFVHENFEFVNRPDLMVDSDEVKAASVFIEIVSHKNNKNVVVGSIYRSPDTDIFCLNNSSMNILELINKENKMSYHWGLYINTLTFINLFKSEIHSPTEDFLNHLYENLLSDHQQTNQYNQ